jgi:hypothetical protein
MPVFISYSEKDQGPYSSLCMVLESEGIEYWDPKKMKLGSSLKEQLREAIAQCDLCIFLATRSSVESQWCLAEIGAFWGAGKRIILYKANPDIDEARLPPIFQGDLWTCNVRDLLHQTKDALSAEDQTRISINRLITDNTFALPPQLTMSGFAFPKPEWLSNEAEQYFTEIAKGALLLLAVDRTDSGCWSKTYLHRRRATGNDLPLARGSLTGTPSGLLAFGSYGAECIQIISDWISHPLSETLAVVVTRDGRYLRGKEVAQMGRIATFEPLRHVAGGFLSAQLIGDPTPNDITTLRLLCTAPPEPIAYDRAIVSRALLQALFNSSFPVELRQQAAIKYEELLESLVDTARSALTSNIIWADQYEYGADTNNQWGTALWVLPNIAIKEFTPKPKKDLESILRRFLLAQSADDPAGKSLLPKKTNNALTEVGRHVFGSAIALLAWRTLELHSFSETEQSSNQAEWQAQRMVNRFLHASSDLLEIPARYAEDEPETLEGYLGWTGLCLAAASLGIRIKPVDCHKVLELTQQINAAIDSLPDKQDATILQLINDAGLLQPPIAISVAQAAAQIALFYRSIE